MNEPDGEVGESPSSQQGNSRAELSGTAADVVQARNVHGGVHFYQSRPGVERVPQQLPSDVRGFVNRVNALADLDELLSSGREHAYVITVSVIAGTAGVGKTSLALHWAHRVRHLFPEGQLYVNLRGYDPGEPMRAEQVLDRFLRALNVPSTAIPNDVEDKGALYRSVVANQRILIFLDNAATVGQIRPLLPGTATCLVIVTSRSRLSGLVARDGARRLTIDTLSEAEAVDLLEAAISGYREGDMREDLVELARLCARLPLALRIAAERAASRPWMPLEELIRDLRDESGLWAALTSEDGDESDAVRAVFAWSYRALSVEVARLFRLLGLHPGPDFSVAAAAALADRPHSQTRHVLDVLAGAHLLEELIPGRYQFHDLLRIQLCGRK